MRDGENPYGLSHHFQGLDYIKDRPRKNFARFDKLQSQL